MNILIDKLPTEITIDGINYAVNSNFRVGILFEILLADGELDEKQKLYTAFQIYFIENKPPYDKTAIDSIIDFYLCGQKPVRAGRGGKTKNRIIYDFEHDAQYIYAAFLEQYGIDLQDIEYLHWWKFAAMFRSLKADTEIQRIMQIRATDAGKIKDKERKQDILRQQALYRIPDNLTPEQKAANAGAIFGNAKR
jgi:hypothetical protein